MGADELVPLASFGVVERAITIGVEEDPQRRRVGTELTAGAAVRSLAVGTSQHATLMEFSFCGLTLGRIEPAIPVGVEAADDLGWMGAHGRPLLAFIVKRAPLVIGENLLELIEEVRLGRAAFKKELSLLLENVAHDGTVGSGVGEFLAQIFLKQLGCLIKRWEDSIAFELDLVDRGELLVSQVERANRAIEIEGRCSSDHRSTTVRTVLHRDGGIGTTANHEPNDDGGVEDERDGERDGDEA
jgi:hypothetical protein